MSANSKLPPPPPAPSNGVITAPAGNRKKQKRRAKQQAAQKAASQLALPPPQPSDQPADVGYNEDALGYQDDDDDYSDAEPDHYDEHYPPHATSNGVHSPPPPAPTGKKKNKKRASAVEDPHHHGSYSLPVSGARRSHVPPLAMPAAHHAHQSIWNTSNQQERQNIREYWLSLSEEERKNLLKIEKDTVLKKMKQQQKHSCSCSVCGRKRTAIEEELEVLYEGYYEELEQYAHHDQPPLPSADGLMPKPLQHSQQPRHPLSLPPPNTMPPQHHQISRIREDLDDEDEFSEEEEDEEEFSEEDEYSDEEPEMEQYHAPTAPPGVPNFLDFGSHLTVKGILTPWVEKLKAGLKGNADNLLTVADDLLKNDGRKFIEMMEQLAERRMQRESRSQYEAEAHAGGYPPGDPGYDHGESMAADDEYDDDEASYDSQEEFDDDMDEEDEMGGLTEEQRMQEGRRMFQIFAARMFEQRVLNAYREKVATEKAAALVEELDNDAKREEQQRQKKARDAAKKKEKKKQQQQAKLEEKAKREAEKAEEEARLREAEEKKQEEQRRKKEEQKKKREEEKRKHEEEKRQKDETKLRKQQEEQQRREEAERKAREAKAAEKAKKEEQRKRERDERDAREKEARERKAQEEKDKKEREARAKAEKEAKEREKTAQQAAHPPNAHPHPHITKRPSQAGMVAIPGVYPKQTPSGISSPHPQIATPAIPKAPTPARPRQASQQGSHASSPKQAHSQLSGAPSKSSSPGSAGPQQASNQPKTILQKPSNQQPIGQQNHQPVPASSPLHQQSHHPQGFPHAYGHPVGLGGMSSLGIHQGPPAGNLNMGGRGHMPMYPHQAPPTMGMPNRPPFPGMGMNGIHPPPGMNMLPPQGRGYPFDGPGGPPPGFHPQPLHQYPRTSPTGHSPVGTGSEQPRQPGHSRQPSASERERFESAANQPIARPAPIQRPGSVRPQGYDGNPDVEDLSKHLGSSALLDDADDVPPSVADVRRHSSIPINPRNINIPASGLGQLGNFGAPTGPFGTPGPSFSTPFGQSPVLGQNWGSLPNVGMGNWMNNHNAFAANGFGPMSTQPMRAPGAPLNRALTLRLAICNACKQLSSRGDGDDYHDVDLLLQHMQRTMDQPLPSLAEIETICETVGDGQNGGGELRVRKNENDANFAVKWEADAGTPDQGRGRGGLSVIGSPPPIRASPAAGSFGAPGMSRPQTVGSQGG
ncbi:Hypothetical predicted protein [Lecanosticta acicola]|uniref:Stress response protein NST1 n=1 Tax=Lecanosticta acicola TaxID=111012 RepID=A0AAI9EDY2_9PEZI|nr:Hypothetical predicted protein [Lecanosticta acicola]